MPKRTAFIALFVLVGCSLAACGADEKEAGMRVDWDLSQRHTLDEVQWPEESLDLDTTRLVPVESARIKLPGDRLLEMGARTNDIGLYRRSRSGYPLPDPEGRILTKVEVYTKPIPVRDAYDEALALADQLDIPRDGIDAWRKRRDRGVDPIQDRTFVGRPKPLGGKGGPEVAVEFTSTENDGSTWTVFASVSWPEPRPE